MGEAKPSQHAGFVEICVAVCRPEFMARSSQLYYFMVSPGHRWPGQAQATDLLTEIAGPSRALWANPGHGDGCCPTARDSTALEAWNTRFQVRTALCLGCGSGQPLGLRAPPPLLSEWQCGGEGEGGRCIRTPGL